MLDTLDLKIIVTAMTSISLAELGGSIEGLSPAVKEDNDSGGRKCVENLRGWQDLEDRKE